MVSSVYSLRKSLVSFILPPHLVILNRPPQAAAAEAEAARKKALKALPVRRDPTSMKWETHTKGFASRYLARFGFKVRVYASLSLLCAPCGCGYSFRRGLCVWGYECLGIIHIRLPPTLPSQNITHTPPIQGRLGKEETGITKARCVCMCVFVYAAQYLLTDPCMQSVEHFEEPSMRGNQQQNQDQDQDIRNKLN